MTAVVIRPVTGGDAPAITAIYAAAVAGDTATFELEAPSAAEITRRIAAIADAGHPFLVAEYNAQVCGFAYASTFRARAAFALTLEDSVYVAPLAQRRGIGRALLDQLIDAASKAGFCQMVAVIGDSTTKDASIALHAAAGFRQTGTLEAVGRKHDRWLDIVLMQRALGRG